MKEKTREARSVEANAAVALGLVTVGFAASLYTPPAEAQLNWGGPFYSNAGMQLCVCDGENECAPCFSGS